MKKFKNFILISILILVFTSSSFSQIIAKNDLSYEKVSNQKPILQRINRRHIFAHVSGEIKISEICNYTELEYPDFYLDVKLNGTVINSTVFDPFMLWPPLSFRPNLGTITLPDDYTVFLKMKLFEGKLYIKDDGKIIRFYGAGYLVHLKARPKQDDNHFPLER